MQRTQASVKQRGNEAVNYLFSSNYEELKRIACRLGRCDQSVALTPAALVNEAWIKLSRSPKLGFLEPPHFRRVAARAMRQHLVESGRRRRAQKRSRLPEFHNGVTISMLGVSVQEEQRRTSLHDALSELAAVDPRQARVVRARFFVGLQTEEIAVQLGISESTVLRDWRLAKAWLSAHISQGANDLRD